MIPHTNAFANYRALSQGHLDFVVVVCHAVPALQADLTSTGHALSSPPDYFKPDTKVRLSQFAPRYQDELARAVLISVFSYFESYVKNALREIADFQGGAQTFLSLAKSGTAKYMKPLAAVLDSSKAKLQTRAKPGREQRYRKHSKLLEAGGYRFPTELLAHYGAVNLLEKTDEKRGMRAWEIPDVLRDCLCFPITASDRKTFDSIRTLRNEIAHGNAPAITLRSSLKASKDLHSLGARIDRHIIDHFLVLQAFV